MDIYKQNNFQMKIKQSICNNNLKQDIFTCMITHCSTLQASSINIARLRFLSLASVTRLASSSGKFSPSRLHIECKMPLISEAVGAGTRIRTHRDRIAGKTRDVEFAQRINLHVLIYFSIVLRSACCASLVSWSTFDNNTTIISYII